MTDQPSCKPDDPISIKNKDKLLRRIPKAHFPNRRVVPAAFNAIFCSVEIEKKLECSPLEFLGSAFSNQIKINKREQKGENLLKNGWMVAAVAALCPRSYDQSVYPEPCEIPFKDLTFVNKSHAEICGIKSDDLLFDLAELANANLLFP